MSNTPTISVLEPSVSNSSFLMLIKEDGLFWGILASLSFSMCILCLHAGYRFGWHDYYISWTGYLLLAPLVVLIKWLNQKMKIDIGILDVLAKFVLGFSLAYNVTPVLLTTPHAFIDTTLLKMDTWLHVSTLALLNFTQQHPDFHKLMIYCYTRLDGSFVMLIILLSIFKKKTLVSNMLTMSLIALFVAALSFYFFPAFGPSLVLKSPYFPYHYASMVSSQYHQVQHALPIDTHTFYAGFVSMPSIHTFIASLAIYTCFACKELRWYLLPIVAFNILIIASTMFLGEHYFVDLIAAWLLLGVIIAVYRYSNKTSCQRSLSCHT